MAGDSVGRDLDKRTRELSKQNIKPGDGLAAQQIAQNQLQAIQNEQRNNLTQQRLQAASNAQAQQVAVQAAQVGTMAPGPAVETLKKYGLTKPKTIKTQSHNIKVAPPNITINTTNNTTTTTGGGPTAGRDLAFRQQATQQAASTNKFKQWLSGLLLSQKEENAKREREFNKRDSALVRSSNKMLKRIEAAGRDIATNLNPKVIGTTVGNQFRMLLMIFALGFLAKHWDKVMNVLGKIVGFFENSLDYFGITNRQDGRPSPFYSDLLTFFGAKSDENSLFQVFGRLGKELVDYLKLKLEHAMSLRGDAIKNIKFPEIDTGDIFKTLSSIAGYVGNILTAMMDPKKGVADSIKQEVNASMDAVQRDSAKESVTFSDEVKGVKGLKDTSYGDYAAVTRQALTHNALDEMGSLRNNTWASISQGRDLTQAYNNSKNGDIDIARMGGGLQRLQDTATSKGYVTLDSSTINQLFGDKLQGLIQSKDIQPVQMKYVQVKKTDQDLADENADISTAFVKGGVQGYILDQIPGSGMVMGGAKALDYGAKGAAVGAVGAAAGGTIGAIEGYARSTMAGGALLGAAGAAWNKMFADDNTLKLVPADDPRPGVALGGQTVHTYYKVNPKALDRLASIITNDTKITKIDSGSERFMKALEKNLVARAGGENKVRSRDYDLNAGYQAIRNIEQKEDYYRKEEQNSDFARSIGTISNNGKRLVNNAYQSLGSAISTVGSYITSFSSGGSNQIRNWLWGGSAPISYRASDASHMSSLVTTVVVPIHDLSGKESTHRLTVHKYLAEDVKTIFEEIFSTTTFRIDPRYTAGWNYRHTNPKRQAKDGGLQLSSHAFGSAIDINSNVNYLRDTRTNNTDVHLGTKAHPVVQIFYRHSWKWLGKDATGKFADPMHFEYAGRPGQVGQQVQGAQTGYMTQEQSDANNNNAYASQMGTYPTAGGSFSVSGTASYGGGDITYQAQGSYISSGPIIPASSQSVDLANFKEGEQQGKTAGFNNPGNLKGHSAFGSGKKGKFAVYDNLEDGFADTAALVTKYLSGKMGTRRNPSVREILNKWCPGNNGTYIQNLATWTGLGTDTPIPLTYDNVFKLVGGITRQEHSSILSQKDYKAGVAKGWDYFMKHGGQPDLEGQPIPEGDNPNFMAAGNMLSEFGESMQSGVVFDDVLSPEEQAKKVQFSKNLETMMNDAFGENDQGHYMKDGYYKDVYGPEASIESIEAAWREDPSKMKRDIKYAPVFAEADKLWGGFHAGEEDMRREILRANTKEEFRKLYSGLTTEDKNHLVGILNQYVTERYRKLDSYNGVKYGDRKNIMDVFGGDERIIAVNQETKDLYAKYMSTGQFDKAKKLIESAYDVNKGTNDAYKKHAQYKLDSALKQWEEGRSYLLHDNDDYRQGYAALAELESLESEKKVLQSKLNDPRANATRAHWEEQLGNINTQIEGVRDRAEQFRSDKKAYTKYDSRVENISDAAGFKSIQPKFDKETKRNLEANRKILELEEKIKNGDGRGFSTEEEANKAVEQWKKELEEFKRQRDESTKRLSEMISDDQKDLLAKHKKDVQELYEKASKNVNDAEKRYLELIKQGKSHADAIIEIQRDYDSQVAKYIDDFGEAMVEEAKKAEELAKQKLRNIIAQLAGVSLDDVDLDSMSGLTTGEATMRSIIASHTKEHKPIADKNLSDSDKEFLKKSGYQYDSDRKMYIHPDYTVRVGGQNVKWKPNGGIVENSSFYNAIEKDRKDSETEQVFAKFRGDIIDKLDEISGKQTVIGAAIGQNTDVTFNGQGPRLPETPIYQKPIGSWTK